MSKKGDPDYRPRHSKRSYNPENRKPTKRDSEQKPETGKQDSDSFFYDYNPTGEKKNPYRHPADAAEKLDQQAKQAADTAANEAAVNSRVDEIMANDHEPYTKRGENFDVNKPEQGVIKAREAFKVAKSVADNPAAGDAADNKQPTAQSAQAEWKQDTAEPVEKADSDQNDGKAETAHDNVNHAEAASKASKETAYAVNIPIRVQNVEIDSADSSVQAQDDLDSKNKTKHKKRHGKRVAIAVLCVILALVVGAVGTFFVMREIGRRSLHNNEGMEVVMPTADSSGAEIISADKFGRIITYNGVSYTFNDDIIALTLIGVDNGIGEERHLNMADAIYILAIDAKTGDTKILGVSRDIMADVDVFSSEGAYIDAEKLQIAYSYAYHGTNMTSGDNTNKSVSRLFFGLPCKNYFALNLQALTTLNDAIGGVTLTSKLTFKSPEDGSVINEGDEVTLHGKEAEIYVRRRDISKLDSNNTRMERQQQYINAFLSSAFFAAKNDISVISDLYSEISSNSDSSLDLSQLTYIASIALTKLGSTDNIEYINLKGELVAGEHAEMYVSNDDVLRTMLDVFYKPMNTADKPTETAGVSSTEISQAAPTNAVVEAAPTIADAPATEIPSE